MSIIVNKFLKFIIRISLVIIVLSNKSFTTKCIINYESWCVFTSVNTTADRPLFQPTADYPNYIKKVKFVNSTLNTLTNEICNTFLNLKEIEVDQAHLQKIADGALHNCTKLTDVSFWTNELTDLPPDIFKNNALLETMTFQHNYLKKIDPSIFTNLTRLKTMAINENYLKEFPLYKMPRIPVLVTIWIHHNDLNDLDEQELIYKFPNLKTIYMEDNPFNCNRLKVILAALQRNQINVDRWHDIPRERPYLLTQVDTVDCLSDEEREKDLSTNRSNIIKEQLDEMEENIGRVRNIGNELNGTFSMLEEKAKELSENISFVDKLNESQNISLVFDSIKNIKLGILKQQQVFNETNNHYQNILETIEKFKYDLKEIKASQSTTSHVSTILFIMGSLLVSSIVLVFWLYRRYKILKRFNFKQTQEEVEFASSTTNIFVN